MTVAVSTLGVLAIVWALLLVVAVGLLVLYGERRHQLEDRRRGPPDRRAGAPDSRAEPVERRAGAPDRRSGEDRRTVQPKSPAGVRRRFPRLPRGRG